MVASETLGHNFFRRLILPDNHGCPNLFLPDHWSHHVKSALLHVISLTRLACVHTWAWAAGSPAPLSMSEWLAGQPLCLPNIPSALFYKHFRLLSAMLFTATIEPLQPERTDSPWA